MRYQVYAMRVGIDDAFGFDLICETGSEEVANFAVDRETSRIGDGLGVIVIEGGKIRKIAKGSRRKAA